VNGATAWRPSGLLALCLYRLDLPSRRFPLLRHVEIGGSDLCVVRHRRAQAASFGSIAIFGYPVTVLRHEDRLPKQEPHRLENGRVLGLLTLNQRGAAVITLTSPLAFRE
jgi:hypothetical protein